MNTPALPGLISVFKRPVSAAQHGSQASAINSTIRIDLKGFPPAWSDRRKTTLILLGFHLGEVGALLALLLARVCRRSNYEAKMRAMQVCEGYALMRGA